MPLSKEEIELLKEGLDFGSTDPLLRASFVDADTRDRFAICVVANDQQGALKLLGLTSKSSPLMVKAAESTFETWRERLREMRKNHSNAQR